MSCKKMLIGNGNIHIWEINLNQWSYYYDKFKCFLSFDELKKLEGLKNSNIQNQFVVSRGALRVILSHYLGIYPHNIKLSYNFFGKPGLCQNDQGESKIKFNISHSKYMLLIGISFDREIGIDIEYIDNILELDNLAKIIFTNQEYREFINHPLENRLDSFYSGWTRKEAILKAIGSGLINDLSKLEVGIAKSPNIKRTMHEEGNIWEIKEIKIHSDYKAAVCVEGKEWNICKFKLDDISTSIKIMN